MANTWNYSYYYTLLSVKVVNTGYVYVVERFSILQGVRTRLAHSYPVRRLCTCEGIYKQQILDIEPQSVITKDNAI